MRSAYDVENTGREDGKKKTVTTEGGRNQMSIWHRIRGEDPPTPPPPEEKPRFPHWREFRIDAKRTLAGVRVGVTVKDDSGMIREVTYLTLKHETVNIIIDALEYIQKHWR